MGLKPFYGKKTVIRSPIKYFLSIFVLPKDLFYYILLNALIQICMLHNACCIVKCMVHTIFWEYVNIYHKG